MRTKIQVATAMLLLIILHQVYAQNNHINIYGTIKGLGNRSVWVYFSDGEGLSRSYKSNAVNDCFLIRVPKQKKSTVAILNIGGALSIKTARKSNNQEKVRLLISDKNINVSAAVANLKAAKIGYTNQ